MRKKRLLLRLKMMMSTNTMRAMPMFWSEPKSGAEALPPPQEIMPTLIRLIPISVTTMPLTRGVMIRRAYFSMRLTNISTTEPATVAPNMAGNPPARPAVIIGPINEKLVPWIHNKPQPILPNRRHWINVATPDTMSDILTKKLVVSWSNCMALAIMSGGVIMATKIANKCCSAAKTVSRKGGDRSSHIWGHWA